MNRWDVLLKEKISNTLYSFAKSLELILAMFLALGVLIGLIDVVKYLLKVLISDANISYDIFRDFLAHVLLLVVAVEFILLLRTYSIEIIGELIVFIITRKMLIYGESMMDMVLGALAIAIIFATLKFFIPKIEILKVENTSDFKE